MRRNPFTRRPKASASVSLDRISAVPHVGLRPLDYPDPTAFLAFESELVRRIDALVAAADEGNPHMLDRAIEHEAEQARQELTSPFTEHMRAVNTWIGTCQGWCDSLRHAQTEKSKALVDLEARMLADRSNYEAGSSPRGELSAAARRDGRRTRRTLSRPTGELLDIDPDQPVSTDQIRRA